MGYTTITVDLVRSALNNTELTAAQTVAQQGGQSDPIVNWITWATDLVRGYVQQKYPLKEAAGVPPSLVAATLSVIVYKLLQRIAPQLAEARKEDYDGALELLKMVAKGEFNPDDAATGSGSTIEVVNENERQATREKMAGL